MQIKHIFILIGILASSIYSQSLSDSYRIASSIEFLRNGSSIQNPYSGGYQSLYVQVLDLDKNGLVDLVLLNNGFYSPQIFEQSIIYSHEFLTKSIQLNNIKLDRWFQFVDFDFDGDFDVLTLDDFDVLGVQLNTGSNGDFVFMDFIRLQDTQTNLIITEFGNYPVIYDYNSDGLFDLFLSTQTDGRIIYYENTGLNGSVFELKNSNFGNVSVVSIVKDDLHGKSTFAFSYLRNIDRLDIIWGDQFQQYFYYLTNTGDLLNPNYVISNTSFSLGGVIQSSAAYNVPIPINLTNDNFEDMIVLPQFTNQNNFQYYSRFADTTFSLVSTELISTIDEGLLSFVDSYDINSDGLTDLIISTFRNSDNYYHLSFYENIGSLLLPKFQEFEFSKTLQFPWQSTFENAYDFQIIDLNSNDKWDIVYVDDSGNLKVSFNSGTTENPVFSSVTTLKSGIGNVASFKILDINSDANLELISASQSGLIQLFSSSSQLFDQTISTNLLSFQYNGWINFDQFSKNKFLLYFQKEQLFYTFIIDSNLQSDSLQLHQLNLPDVGKSATLSFVNLVDNGPINLAFGNDNGGLILLEANPPIVVKSDPEHYPIYPNPSSKNQQMRIDKQPTYIRFYNILGQIVNIKYQLSSDYLKWTFPSNLSSGIYFLQLDSQVYKLIKLIN